MTTPDKHGGSSPTIDLMSVILHVTPLLWRGLGLMATLIVMGILLQWLLRLDTDWIDTWIRGHGLVGGTLFVLVGSVSSAIGFPRQILSFLGGYAFNFIIGTALALIATLIGAIGAFHYARFMGRTFLVKHFSSHLKKIDNFLISSTITMTLVLRLSPFTNNLATNLAGGISGVRSLPFFVGSILGYFPQTLIFAMLGSGFNFDPGLRTGISIALFVISSLLGVWLWYRRGEGMNRY